MAPTATAKFRNANGYGSNRPAPGEDVDRDPPADGRHLDGQEPGAAGEPADGVGDPIESGPPAADLGREVADGGDVPAGGAGEHGIGHRVSSVGRGPAWAGRPVTLRLSAPR
jgi:hypothetical protein